MDENEIYHVDSTMQNKEPEQQGKSKRSYFYCGLISGMVIAVFLSSIVYFLGNVFAYRDAAKNAAAKNATESTKSTEKETEENTAITPFMVEKLKVIESVIDKYFYHEDIDRKVLEEGAYRGMIQALEDPYSTYYSKQELEDLYQESEGVYYGIGAYVGLDSASGLAKISSVIADTPAEEAGLRENDIIYKVDGTEVYDMTLQEVVALIKGEEGTNVTLTLIRDGEEFTQDVVRRKVESPTVNYEMYDNGMAYIQIVEFDSVTVDQFAEALAMARGSDMKGLILDLRSNPGGNLSAVVDIARMMLPEGMIVYTEDREGKRDEYTCDGTRELNVPMVVLVNGNSASASEILAGAIKDYGIGTLLGTKTFGKGIVQRPIELSDGSAVKLTISSYFTPKGINIHGIGIEPDEVCEFDSEKYYSEEKIDNQLERAKELLETKIQ